MAARSMWKALLIIGKEQIPVKLYAALQDRDVHFRLLHAKDDAPVKQAMVNPETEEVVPKELIKRGVVSSDGDVVILEEEELVSLQPDPSREIRLTQFLPIGAIDRRYYRRPYYLGPDGSDSKYAALIQLLTDSGREGVAHWVMRNKSYVGALRLHEGYPILIALRHADEVIAVSSIRTPKGAEPNPREVEMARQLIDMLAADFSPEKYHDEYRNRVRALVEAKAAGGGKVTQLHKTRKQPAQDLAKLLQASLQEKQHARRH